MASITKTPAGTFKATIKKDGSTLKSKTFRLKTHASAWAKRIEGDFELMSAYSSRGAVMTFDELSNEYMEQWNGKDRSFDYKVRYWRELLSTRRLIDIDSQLIRDGLKQYGSGVALRGDGFDEKGKPKLTSTGRPRSNASVNRIKATLSAIFQYAFRQGYISNNPVRAVANLKENRGIERWLSDDERQRLLAACKTSEWDKLYLLVIMALTTGARRGELLELSWSDIDFKARTAMLNMTKNGDPRVLTLPSPAIEALMPHRGFGLVFPGEKTPHNPYTIKKPWAKALKQAEIENFRFHDLRHSAASYLVMNGATLYETAEVLGHKSVQTTKRYAHLSTQHKAELTERVFGGII